MTGPSLGRFCRNEMTQSFHSEEQFVVRYTTTRRREGYWRLEYVINGGNGKLNLLCVESKLFSLFF